MSRTRKNRKKSERRKMEKMIEDELRKTIVVDANAAVVFKALTDETELVQWMPTEAKMDAHVGGVYEFRYYSPERNVDSTARGKILELIPNIKLSYTWNAQKKGSTSTFKESIVTWILDELPDGKTRVTLIHSGESKEVRQDRERGWSHFLGQLANFCKK